MEAIQVDIAAEMLYQEFLPATGDCIAPLTPETLHQIVTNRVAFLLDNDFARLMSSLYQIDVAEDLVKEAFSEHVHGEIPGRLATLIIDREMTKARSRAERRFT
jgi:hypothetical protein